MSIRLKSIELDSFRAFENKTKFDFFNKKFDEISNLIVIYAPNGTGKTSFFDAIEWSLSGEIKRISENKPVKEIADKERKYILKNKYTQADVGLVNIQFENNSSLKMETKRLDGKRTIDYTPGNKIIDTVQLTDDTFKSIIDKNMLTHDQIDSFLRFKNAEQRYDALSIFWDRDNQSEDYKNIDLIIYEINKQKESHTQKISDLEEKIKKIEINPGIWSEISNLKKKYYDIDEEIDIIVDKELNLQELYIESTKLLSLNENTIINYKKKIDDTKKLSNEIQVEYKLIPERILSLNKLIVEQTKLLKKILNLEELEQKKKVLLKEKIELSEHIKRSAFIVEYSPSFTIQKEELEIIKTNEKSLIDKRIKEEKELISVQIEIQKQKLMLTDFKKVNTNLSNELSEIINLNKYPIIQDRLKKLNNEVLEIKNQKNIYENLINTNILQVSKLKEIYSLNELQLIKKDYSQDKDYQFIRDRVRHISEMFNKIEFYKKELKQKKEELSYVEKLGTDIEKLKKIGYSIASSTKTSTCPLCSHDFNEFEQIIQRINDNKANLSRTAKITKDINNLEKELEIEKSKIDAAVRDLKLDINKETNNLETKIDRFKEKSILLDSYNKSKKQEHSALKVEGKMLDDLMHKFNIDIEKFASQINKKESLLKFEIEDNKLKYSELEQKNIEQEKLQKEQENVLTNVLTTIEQNKRRIKDIEENNEYVLYKKVTNFYENLNVTNFVDYLKEKENKLEYAKKNERELIEEKKSLEQKVIGYKKKSIIEKIEEFNSNILKFEERKNAIEQKSISMFDELIIDDNRFNLFITELNKKTLTINRKNEILSQLSGLSSNYLIETKIDVLKKNLTNFETIKTNLENELIELSQLKITKLNDIKKQIKDTFNLDVVNQIFQMIEPHPEFKEISFKINENSFDKLGLDIMCRREDDEESAPILYLSSAQVNILSLSIFLGVALENTDKMNTIFMDDPIQHLDGLNELSFIDLLRVISFQLGKQVVFSTHNQQFFNLCKRKLDSNYHNSSFLDISEFN